MQRDSAHRASPEPGPVPPESLVHTCSGCGAGVRIPVLAMDAILRCPRCKTTFRALRNSGDPAPDDDALGTRAQYAKAKIVAAGSQAVDRVKRWLNVGGVSVKVNLKEPYVVNKPAVLIGSAILSTTEKRRVTRIEISLIRTEANSLSRASGSRVIYVAGTYVDRAIELKPGQNYVVNFALDYELPTTLKEEISALGTLGKYGSLAILETVRHQLKVECDVEGAAFRAGKAVQLPVKV